MMTALILVAVFALTKLVRPDPWFDPIASCFGMILQYNDWRQSRPTHGLSTGAWQNRRDIEARLALGAKDGKQGAQFPGPR